MTMTTRTTHHGIELTVPLVPENPVNWHAIAKHIIEYQLRLRPTMIGTQETGVQLLRDALRFWGSGTVSGVFTTSWRRAIRETGSVMVVTSTLD